MKILSSILVLLMAAFISCTEEGVKGSLIISVTDSPSDADNVKSVNLFITSAEAKRGDEWKSLRHFDQAVGVNLLDYSGGQSMVLIEQFIDPGDFTQLRFSLNLADLGSSLIRSPQCNVALADGTTKPIYYFEAGTTDMIVTYDFGVVSRGRTDITIDFDVRKSLIRDDQGNFIFKPSVRLIETAKAGHIAATVSNHDAADRIIVYAYSPGQFSAAETAAPAAGEVRFKHAITSAKVTTTKFGLGFLPAASYDLIFVKHSETGEFVSVLGRVNGVSVKAGETLPIDVDLNGLGGS